MLPILILAPLVGLILLNLLFRRRMPGVALALVTLLAAFQAAMVVWPQAWFWTVPSSFRLFHLQLNLAAGAPDAFNLGLTAVLLLSIAVVVFAAAWVGKAMFRDDRARFNFLNVMLIAMIGMNGTVLVADVFTLYVFLEITSVASFVLIASNRDGGGLEGALKYLVMSAVASVLMLSAVALLLVTGADTTFASVRAALASPAGSSVLAKLAVGVFACGLFIKGGLVPFHGWLPAAYSAAPAAVSVFLAGIATKATGVYALIRLAGSVFPQSRSLSLTILTVGAASVIVGALAALGQKDIKRLLAYSSISQVGYILLGLGCAGCSTKIEWLGGMTAGQLGLAGAVFHVFNHAMFKGLLFVNAAALEQRLGTTDMTRMGGLSSRMPVSGVTNLLALLSTAGIPPLSGFWSKLIIILALWKAQYHVAAFIAVLFSVVTLAYLLVMQRRVFFGKLPEHLAEIREADGALTAPAVVLAAITVGVGLCFPMVYEGLIAPVCKMLAS